MSRASWLLLVSAFYKVIITSTCSLLQHISSKQLLQSGTREMQLQRDLRIQIVPSARGTETTFNRSPWSWIIPYWIVYLHFPSSFVIHRPNLLPISFFRTPLLLVRRFCYVSSQNFWTSKPNRWSRPETYLWWTVCSRSSSTGSTVPTGSFHPSQNIFHPPSKSGSLDTNF